MIQLKNVRKTYVMGDEKIHALDGVTLTIEKGDFVAVVGPSGSGKTTLMNVVGLLDVPDEGEYLLNGKDIKTAEDSELAKLRNKNIGFVFQSFNLLPKLNALENIEVPLMYSGISAKKSRELAYAYIEKVGLKSREKHLPNQLSRWAATKSSNCKSTGMWSGNYFSRWTNRCIGL